jgi:hypothetical protein
LNSFPNVNDMPDILGYGQRPRGFTALFLALSRLGFPGGAGLGYPMAAAGPTATMGPAFSPYGMGYGQQMMGYGQPMADPAGAGWDLQNPYIAALQAQALQQQLMQGQAAAVPAGSITYMQ